MTITPLSSSPVTTLKYLCINHGEQCFCQFEIIINVLVTSFRWINVKPTLIRRHMSTGYGLTWSTAIINYILVLLLR